MDFIINSIVNNGVHVCYDLVVNWSTTYITLILKTVSCIPTCVCV